MNKGGTVESKVFSPLTTS